MAEVEQVLPALDCPESLWQLCLEYCVANLEAIATYDNNYGWTLHDSIYLPVQTCDSLLHTFQGRDIILNDDLLHIFQDHYRTRLQRVNLRGSDITDRGIRWIMPHEPKDLNLMGCPNLTTGSLYYINKYGKNLVTLTLGTYWGLFSDLDLTNNGERNSEEVQSLVQTGLCLPRLQGLTLRNMSDLMLCAQDVVRWMLQPMRRLTFLDLSGCDIDVGDMDVLEHLQDLTKLILYNVRLANPTKSVAVISKLTKLR